MESDSSCGDLTHNEELPIKLEETSISINKEDDQSDVVSLRLLDLTDVDDFMEWFTDDNVNKFCSDDNSFMSKEAAMRYIADVVVPHPWFRAICLNGKPIGSISVLPFHGSDSCRGEIGYELSSKYWGKGIATKAVKMVASTIFFEWPHLERLEAVVAVDNLRSQRVLEKAGFVKEDYEHGPLILTETGWPSDDEHMNAEETQMYAEKYLRGLISHLKSGLGTPLRKEGATQTYIYQLFDDDNESNSKRNNLSSDGGETVHQYWRVMYHNMTMKYNINYSLSRADRWLRIHLILRLTLWKSC